MKMDKISNVLFTKKDTCMTNKFRIRWQSQCLLEECKLSPQWQICWYNEKIIIPSAGEYVKKLECLDTAFGNVKCYRHFGKKSNNFFKS